MDIPVRTPPPVPPRGRLPTLHYRAATFTCLYWFCYTRRFTILLYQDYLVLHCSSYRQRLTLPVPVYALPTQHFHTVPTHPARFTLPAPRLTRTYPALNAFQPDPTRYVTAFTRVFFCETGIYIRLRRDTFSLFGCTCATLLHSAACLPGHGRYLGYRGFATLDYARTRFVLDARLPADFDAVYSPHAAPYNKQLTHYIGAFGGPRAYALPSYLLYPSQVPRY